MTKFIINLLYKMHSDMQMERSRVPSFSIRRISNDNYYRPVQTSVTENDIKLGIPKILHLEG